MVPEMQQALSEKGLIRIRVFTSSGFLLFGVD